ncbi:MAG TPA: 3,4-dihydroxy-2-butanone-4-phosphate synthase [Pyrinomonadaceae bacterium]|nr:3,4-dihydroxy-2-butanone-4-phosphate synthase [Pyrinomonadaceae bacterium]
MARIMLIAAKENTVRRVVTTRLPTKWGVFQTIGFERETSNRSGRVETALAVILGDLSGGAPLLRIHSECFTGEVLGSLRCDCKDQLELSLSTIAEEGRGLVIYEHQEGRGIGLMSKLQAYALQDEGLDTVEANHALGFEADCRDFSLPVAILHELGLSRVRLLTNNLQKSKALLAAGIEVVGRVGCEVEPTPDSIAYLRTKKEKMGHALTLQKIDTNTKTNGENVEDDFEFANIDAALAELKAGRMIVVVDDEDRENEGDLTMAAEMVTPEAINFMATHGRGLICLAMNGERLDELQLAPMAPDNTAVGGTAFTVSIDVKGYDVSTGISAYDRSRTIKAAIDPTSFPEDFGRPGHIFPLRARKGGVLERRGQTEAAVDLATLAGLYPAGVICEIVNDDGSMARVPDLKKFCKKHGLVMITVAELARYRVDLDFEGAVGVFEGIYPSCPTLPKNFFITSDSAPSAETTEYVA